MNVLNWIVIFLTAVWIIIRTLNRPIRRPMLITFIRAAWLPFLAAIIYAAVTGQIH